MIHDSQPHSWRPDPDRHPTTEELRLLALAKLYAKADEAVQQKAGVVCLARYRELTAERKALLDELLSAAAEYHGPK